MMLPWANNQKQLLIIHQNKETKEYPAKDHHEKDYMSLSKYSPQQTLKSHSTA
ncbi:MAG: hypothetical protein LBU40_00040 [Methanobrevibacter sp.]|jgi:hypothetical protein|nr:hypothetical protein [Methanobrevibacter sp.]